jgi:16S rRNA (uracil1498-N3)-methyltransferase
MAKHISRIFVPDSLSASTFPVSGADFFHLKTVLRVRIGDPVLAFNESSGEWLCKIVNITKNEIVLKKQNLTRSGEPVSKGLMLAFGVIKPTNLCVLIEKSVELGVTDFFPLITEYTNYSVKEDKIRNCIKLAVEQCNRINLPMLHNTRSLREFSETIKKETWFSCIERRKAQPLCKYNLIDDCGFLIGPEGGFSELEKDQLGDLTTCVTISNNILRTETAAIFCVANCACQRLYR